MFDPYFILISVSILVALSYVFDLASKKFKIPSVLFLLATGIIIKQIADIYSFSFGDNFNTYLQFIGVIGLIMIVLEAAVDLNLSREKVPLVQKSLLLAILVLILSSISIGYVLMKLTGEPFFNSLVNAIPLSVVSSAVLIPSVHTLTQNKKEFLIYESTFSDIIGIMFFNFIVLQESDIFTLSGFTNIIVTIILSVIVSFVLVFFFSRIKTEVKIFLMISILAVLYSIGKQFHLSSLLMIFVFGIVLNNARQVFLGWLGRNVSFKSIDHMKKDFRTITGETAFLVRTFFFVAFGMSIDLNSLLDLNIILIGSIIVVILYLVRYLNFKIFLKTDVFPEIFLAPRGLITILLFFQIPAIYQIEDFMGILFFVILATGIIMMIALVTTKESEVEGFTVVDFGLGPASDHANVDVIGKFSEFDDLEETED